MSVMGMLHQAQGGIDKVCDFSTYRMMWNRTLLFSVPRGVLTVT
jgi:hypothetical protein